MGEHCEAIRHKNRRMLKRRQRLWSGHACPAIETSPGSGVTVNSAATAKPPYQP